MLKKWYALYLLLVACSFFATAQSSEDSQNDAATRGVRYETGRAVAWFPNDALSAARMREVTDSLHLTIRSLENLMGAPYGWQVFEQRPVTYYFVADAHDVYTSPSGDIYVSVESLEKKDISILRETTNVLLRSKKGNWQEATPEEIKTLIPQWLLEGLTELMIQKVIHENVLNRLYHESDQYLQIDLLCRERLRTPAGAQTLQLIGTLGLSGGSMQKNQRNETFSICACSFAKFIADQYGLFVLLNAVSLYQREHISIEGRTGLTVDTLKASWLSTLQTTK